MKNVIKTPNFIKLAVLTVLNALYAGFIFYEYIGITIGIAFMVSSAAYAVAAFICALIPVLMGLLLVDRPKWWLISLPVQFLLGTAVQYFSWKYWNPSELLFGNPAIDDLMLCTLIFLAVQAVGVGIKTLWLRRNAWKNISKT